MNAQASEHNSEIAEPPDNAGCGSAVLFAVLLPLFTRYFHSLLIPQVLEENAYFVGKAPYGLMYIFSVPAGLFLGMATQSAWYARKKNPQFAQGQLRMWGLVGVNIILLCLYNEYASGRLTGNETDLRFMLLAYLPWFGPIFAWSFLLLIWSFLLGRKIKLGSREPSNVSR